MLRKITCFPGQNNLIWKPPQKVQQKNNGHTTIILTQKRAIETLRTVPKKASRDTRKSTQEDLIKIYKGCTLICTALVRNIE